MLALHVKVIFGTIVFFVQGLALAAAPSVASNCSLIAKPQSHGYKIYAPWIHYGKALRVSSLSACEDEAKKFLNEYFNEYDVFSEFIGYGSFKVVRFEFLENGKSVNGAFRSQYKNVREKLTDFGY